MSVPAERPGLTDQLFARMARARMPALGPAAEALLGLACAVAAAALLLAGERIPAGALILLAAWRGGLAAGLAARPGVAAPAQATVLVANVLAGAALSVAAGFWTHANRDLPGPLAVGFLALAGGLMLAYARIRVRASAGIDLPDGPLGVASRELRLAVLAVGAFSGQLYWALLLDAALAHAAVLGHLGRLRLTLRG